MNLTPRVLSTLEALDAADGKVMSYSNLRLESGCKKRSFGYVFERMERANLVTRDYDKVHITFAGMRSLTNHRQNGGKPMN